MGPDAALEFGSGARASLDSAFSFLLRVAPMSKSKQAFFRRLLFKWPAVL